MTKKLPILRRLEVALSETTSVSEREEVYGLLGVYCARIESENDKSSQIDFEKFYQGVDHRTFSVIQNGRKVTSEDIKNGKNLAECLTNRVILPQKGEKGYRTKMLAAMEAEFSLFKSIYSLQDGKNTN